MTYQSPAVLATIETSELLAEAFGTGSICTPMGHTCH
jgi:hypothetical protein